MILTNSIRMNKKIIASFLLVTILFVSAIAGAILYYESLVNQKNSAISSLNNQIDNLNMEIANLTSQISNLTNQTRLTSANLVTALGITEIRNTSSISRSYNRLYIDGSVTNQGAETAYGAGLHVVAYSQDGTLEINMTVPLTWGEYAADSATESYVSTFDGVTGSLQLGSLVGGQSTNVDLDIYHEGTVTNWTVTPVWTNTP